MREDDECLYLCNSLIYNESETLVYRLSRVYSFVSVNCTLLLYYIVHSWYAKVYTLMK